MQDITVEFIDLMELLNFTLSDSFTEKWQAKYSKKFITLFQLELLSSFSKKKPIKINTLFTYLTVKCKYSPIQVKNFFDSIQIDLYNPIIYGRL